MLRAVRTAVHFAIRFETVPDDPALANLTGGSEPLNGALKAVKDIGLTIHDDGEGLVISVPAGFAGIHGCEGVRQSAEA